jgi:ComF family protein
MNNVGTIYRDIMQAIRWLAPASCLLCRCQHNRACTICVDCEAAFSRNQHACHRCALPLQPTQAPVVNRLDLAYLSVRRLCPPCIKNPPHFFGAHAPYLMRTGMRELIHLWKFQNRPQLTGLLADLLLSRLPTASAESLTTPWASAQTVLVPIPTQWRRQVRRGFDHTWLLANGIRSRCSPPVAVRPWLDNRHYRPAQHRLDKKSRLADAKDRFVARPSIAGHKVVLIDDVMTTGATARAAARACAEAGALSVAVWCLARTPAPFAVE